MSDRLEVWDPGYIDHQIRRWDRLEQRFALGWVSVGFGFAAGRHALKVKRMKPRCIEAAARSLVLKCTGLSPNEADRIAGEEFGYRPRTVAVYRKRMRERLDGGETRLQQLVRAGRVCSCGELMCDAAPSGLCGFCEAEIGEGGGGGATIAVPAAKEEDVPDPTGGYVFPS
jgi:hypothetical protein